MPAVTKTRFGSSALFGAILSSLCLLSLLMAPFVRAHDFGEHLRVNEARRETIRHTCIETAPVHDAERLAHAVPEPDPIVPPPVGEVRLEPISYQHTPPVAINRLLMRYKLGYSRAGNPDPLL